VSPNFTGGRVSVLAIVCSEAFSRGVEDVRAGRAPKYDHQNEDNAWAYERGRHWAVLAPPSMPLFIGKRVNKRALKIFDIENGII
jgi:hypothetical protein